MLCWNVDNASMYSISPTQQSRSAKLPYLYMTALFSLGTTVLPRTLADLTSFFIGPHSRPLISHDRTDVHTGSNTAIRLPPHSGRCSLDRNKTARWDGWPPFLFIATLYHTTHAQTPIFLSFGTMFLISVPHVTSAFPIDAAAWQLGGFVYMQSHR